ncbi:MAG: hypothetical protein ACR2NR_06240 [Solirubrobacteraceae bacterium]
MIAASAAIFAADGERESERARRRLGGRLSRLNEAALIADALLTYRQSIAQKTHARLFATELTGQNISWTATDSRSCSATAATRPRCVSIRWRPGG